MPANPPNFPELPEIQWEQQALLMHSDQQAMLSVLRDRAPEGTAARNKLPKRSLPRIDKVSAA
jgi:hypothetical protein